MMGCMSRGVEWEEELYEQRSCMDIKRTEELWIGRGWVRKGLSPKTGCGHKRVAAREGLGTETDNSGEKSQQNPPTEYLFPNNRKFTRNQIRMWLAISHPDLWERSVEHNYVKNTFGIFSLREKIFIYTTVFKIFNSNLNIYYFYWFRHTPPSH